MLHDPSAKLKPNILAQPTQEEQEELRKSHRLQDSSNIYSRNPRKGKTMNLHSHNKDQKQTTSHLERKWTKDQKENNISSSKPSLLIEFDSEEEQEIIPENGPEHKKNESKELSQSSGLSSIPHKKDFLLYLDSDEGEVSEDQQKRDESCTGQETSNSSSHENFAKNQIVRNEFILDLDQEDEKDSAQGSSSNYLPDNLHSHKQVLKLEKLIQQFKDRYYLQPIPRGKVFQCVVKRDKSGNSVKYYVYDNSNLRNFITIFKDDDGYLVVSRYQSTSTKLISDLIRKQKVIGRIVSNFFGTEFNCMLENTPYQIGKEYPSDSKNQRIITVEYQTNFFGMKGPRKMKAFIAPGIRVKGKGLNQIYDQQKKKGIKVDQQNRVHVFRNKSPKWSPEIGSYVLNFDGRATVSSVKNFIMVAEEESDNAMPKVLFGKFGKELFNLDIRYPFNVLQGIALAISSFDKKLGCE